MTKEDRLIASVETLLAGLKGLASAITHDLEVATNGAGPGMIPAIPLTGRPLLGFATIFGAAREVEMVLEEIRGIRSEPEESSLTHMQTQGSA